MEYIKCDMNAYNLHIIKTNKFKTITMSIVFRRKIAKEEITIRNLLKDVLINSSYNYPTEKKLIVETERLYDLKLMTSNYREGNYSVMSIKTRFLNEKYTEKGMNAESISFVLDLIFNPLFEPSIDKCKKRLAKCIKSLNDNKIRYSLLKLLSYVDTRPYSYNGFGYLEDLDKITLAELKEYYQDIIKNDIIDVYIVGDVLEDDIKKIFRENFKVSTYHKQDVDIIVPELENHKVTEYLEKDDVNQTQLTLLYNIRGLSDTERRYTLMVFTEMLGGSANSILFDTVREKNNYAYYVNAICKPYDNVMMVYSGIDGNKTCEVKKLIRKAIKNITHGKFDDDKFTSAKKTLISALQSSLDSPMGIINNYYGMTLLNSPCVEKKIENINKITREDIIRLSKKISLYSTFTLEGTHEKNND